MFCAIAVTVTNITQVFLKKFFYKKYFEKIFFKFRKSNDDWMVVYASSKGAPRVLKMHYRK